MEESQYQMRVEDSLSAHFFQPDGSSRPGTDWNVGLQRGDRTYQVLVRSYLNEDANRATRKDTDYQGRMVLEYLDGLLRQGWTPEQSSELTIVIPNRPGNRLEVPRNHGGSSGKREEALRAYRIAKEHAPADEAISELLSRQIERVAAEPLEQITPLRNPKIE
ncbi:MAG: hypothetical protein LC776_03325 [Acidobacteria bacterium]|nr:hypothetical protein [Acidobacteriota bacterium]